jgi:hypothetical protein
MLQRVLYIVLLFVLCTSCGEFALRRTKGVIAEYDGKQLTERDVAILTRGLSSADSALVVRDFIRQWCVDLQMEKTISRGAMGGKKAEIERLVDDYRRSLYAYEWERYLVAREMSRHVVDSVVLAYYALHKDKLILRETILRGALLVVPVGAPGLDKMKLQMSKLSKADALKQSDDSLEILEELEKYAYQYGSGYELFLDEWKSASQILLRMPFEEDNLHKLLKQKRQVTMQDSLNIYILQVSEMHSRGALMPLDYARGEIEKMILSQRQVEFIQRKREELYEKALQQGKLKVYEK